MTLPLSGASIVFDPWSETAFTRFECSRSEEISDGFNRWLTTQEAGLDVCEAVEAVSELPSPECFEVFAMSAP
jgi:hypothetical protein